MLNGMELCRTDGHLSVTATLHRGTEGRKGREPAEEGSPRSIKKHGLYLDPEGSHRDDMN